VEKFQMNQISTDLHFNDGISVLRLGYVLAADREDLVLASSGGEVKITSWDQQDSNWKTQREFDLTENGAIWHLEVAKLTDNILDDIIIGGQKGSVIVLSGEGEERWVHRCRSAICGVKIWTGFDCDDHNGSKSHPKVVVLSLDGTIRILDYKGNLLWAQMMAGGANCILFGDIDHDGVQEVIAGGNDGSIRVFEGKKGQLKWFREFHTNIRTLLLQGEKILVGCDDMKIHVVNGITQKEIITRDFHSYIWNTMKLPPVETNPRILISTYSFEFLGADVEEGSFPSIGIYSYPELEPIWERTKLNAQDIQFFSKTANFPSNLLLIGLTGGELLLIELESNTSLLSPELGNLSSMINSVQFYLRNSSKEMSLFLLAGCDDKKLYSICIKPG
jgi:WD40 repeat protein